MSTCRSFLFAMLVSGAIPSIAAAQFTTFIPPRNKVADSVKAVVAAQQQVQQDSITHAQIANMKTWVDSAAGLPPVPTTVADSVAQTLPATPAASVATTDTSTFRNGSRAPATASALPLVAAVGAAALLLGALLLRSGARSRDGESAPVRVRVRARDS